MLNQLRRLLQGQVQDSCIPHAAQDRVVRVCDTTWPVRSVTTRWGDIKFIEASANAAGRVRSFFDKEPETLAWIDDFSPDSVLWDVGANIGLYSLYATKRSIKTLAFEPNYRNFFLLSENRVVNRCDRLLDVFCIALNSVTTASSLSISIPDFGGSWSSFGDAVDFKGRPLDVQMQMRVLGYSIDDLIRVFHLDPPTHLKLDVDGIEDKILAGASQTLASNALKSVLVEVDIANAEYCARVANILN